MQHKWHKEIKAWADGAEIETRFLYSQVEQTWQVTNAPKFEDAQWEFRIKPQPKDEKPQYLYVYGDVQWDLYSYKLCRRKGDFGTYIGKIKLEVEDHGD